MDFDFTTKAGIQKFIIAIVAIIATTGISVLGWSPDKANVLVTILTQFSPIIAGGLYFIVNQIAASGKATASQKVLETKIGMIEALAVTAPAVAIAIASPVTATVIAPVPNIKDKIKIQRALTSTWDGAKAFLLGTFKDRFEAALKRYASLSSNTVETVRKAVEEVIGVSLDEKTCQALGNIPGWLGAMSTSVDIGNISDMFAAIDKTPELAYMKVIFQKRAEWYAVKQAIDELTIRIYSAISADRMDMAKLALQEFGFTQWQLDKSQFSGADIRIWYSTTNVPNTFQFERFDPFSFAGVRIDTMQDI